MESMTKTRKTVIICSSLARWIMLTRVEMMPSARVEFRRKSTQISLPERPVIRSAWTMAIFPAFLMRSTILPMLQMSP